MSTGSLKLASLLIVIAAGGGVAWQAQQGIQHPSSNQAAAESDDSESADVRDDSNEDPFETPEEPVPRHRTIAARDWSDDAALERAAPESGSVTPSKFQRSKTPERLHGSPIPARKAPALSVDKSDTSVDDAGDPFSAAEPTPIVEQPRSQALPADPEPDTAALPDEESFAAEKSAGRARLRAADGDDVDSTDDAAPVLLTSREVPAPARRRGSSVRDQKSSEGTDADASRSANDDPFAGAAPLDLKDEPEDQSLPKSLEELHIDVKPETSAPEMTIPPRDASEPRPKRSSRRSAEPADSVDDAFTSEPVVEEPPPKRRLPALTSEETSTSRTRDRDPQTTPRREPEKTEEDDTFGANPALLDEPQPKLGLPTPRTEELRLDTESERGDSKPSSEKSRRSSKHKDAASTEKSPRLLPVPNAFADESRPALPTDLETDLRPDRDDPSVRPARNTSKFDDLNGDGTPDQSAPKGLQQPRLTIEKIAPKQAVLGQPLIYSVVVKNAGSADAHQVTVEDRIPKGTVLEGTSPRAELVEKRLVWRLGTLKPDEQRKIQIKVIPQEQGPIGSVAKVNFVAEIAAEIEVTAPQLLLSIDAPSHVRLGEKLHVVFKLRNAGRADADNVVLRNLIPEGLRHPAGADLEYAVGKLPAQESREIQLDLIATKNGKVVNQTIITGDGGIKLDEETPIEVVGEQLVLTRTGKGKLFVDKSAVFTSTVANEGTAPAAKVSVAEVVPVGFEFVDASDNGRFNPSTRAVTWTIGPIGPGEELKLSTKLMPKQRGDYRATVTVTGPAGSVATVDAQMKVDGFPAVAVESKTDARLISVGEKAAIKISCKNQGTAAVKNLILSAQLPPELILVDGHGQTAWAQNGNLITFEALPTLDPGASAAFEVRVEGRKEGDTRIELQISADHLTRPLHRDETIRVAPDEE